MLFSYYLYILLHKPVFLYDQGKLQAQARKMARWSAKWRTKVSINKTKYIVFHKEQNHKQNTLHLTFNNHKLETVNTYLRTGIKDD